MYRQARDTSVDDTFNKLECILLRRKESDFSGDGDFWRHSFAKSSENGAEEVGVGEQSSAHAGVGRERFRTPAVEVEPGDVLLNHLCCLNGELRIRGSNLVYKERLLDRVTGEYWLGLAMVGDHASHGCTQRHEQRSHVSLVGRTHDPQPEWYVGWLYLQSPAPIQVLHRVLAHRAEWALQGHYASARKWTCWEGTLTGTRPDHRSEHQAVLVVIGA